MNPLKGYKGTYYEGGIRVPFFVHWPRHVAPGWTTEPITGVDLYPTLCEMAGVDLPEQPLDGVSLIPLLKRNVATLGERALFWHFPAYLQSYQGLTDEQRDPLFRSRLCSIVRLGDWKLHHHLEDNALELYQLRNDIGETVNLASTHPEQAQILLTRLQTWRKEIGAPVPEIKISETP